MRLLIVDDEKNTREGLKWALEREEMEVQTAGDGEEALAILRADPAELVITDLKMPRMDGMELLRHLREEFPETDVVILTGHGTVESAVEAMRVGAFHYLIKPVNLDELKLLLERVVERRRFREENERLRAEVDQLYGFEQIVGRSAAMQEVFQRVRQVAPTRASVLIQGDTGTGKELIARAIHHNSPRRHRPFVAVNCGALAETLLESELFGHEKGAFTNAVRTKPGRFEMADRGTIFLDEISETSPEFQVKLLRVLQEQEIERVGGTQTIKVDIRIIAATNRDLEREVAEGRFREDLFWRLNVVRIVVPPLRERPEDIPLLIEFFLNQFNKEHGKQVTLSPRALALLTTYSWPGNVRQLRTTIESLVILSTSREISPRQLAPEIQRETAPAQTVKFRVGTPLREAEKELIQATLAANDGNKALAARLLGLGRKTLYRKLEEYGIE